MVHQVNQPETIAATAAVLQGKQLVVPAVFHRDGIDQYKGAQEDPSTSSSKASCRTGPDAY